MTVTITPSSQTFGPVPLGTADIKAFHVVNDADEKVELELGGTDAASFSILSGDHVNKNGDGDAYVQYQASTAGSHSATLTVKGKQSDTVFATVTLSGETTAQLSVSPSSLAFGDVEVGATSNATVLVTNATGAAVDLSLSNTVGGTFTFNPSSVAATGLPTLVTVSFVPGDTSADSATLNVGTETCALTGTGYELPEDDDNQPVDYDASIGSAGAKRWKVEVPWPQKADGSEGQSRVWLGKGVNDSDWATVDGCGLDTDGNVYLRANNSRLYAYAEGDALLRSNGRENFAWVHSDGGKSSTLVTSENSVYVAGNGGVMINGGITVGKENGGEYGEKPTTGDIDNAAKVFTAIDIAVGFMLFGMAAKSLKDDWGDSNFVKTGVEIVGTVGAFGAPLVGALGLGGVLPGVTIYGHAGISLFCPAYTAIYGGGGLGLISTFPTMVGLVDSTILAMDDIALKAWKGKVDIGSGQAVEIHASDSTSGGEVNLTASANRHAVGGTVGVKADTINIGNKEIDPTDHPLTKLVSTEGLNIKNTALQSFEVDVAAGLGAIRVAASGEITLAAGAHKIVISPTAGISIESPIAVKVKAGAGEIQLKPTQTMVKYGVAQFLKMENGSTAVTYMKNKIDLKATGIESTATITKIG